MKYRIKRIDYPKGWWGCMGTQTLFRVQETKAIWPFSLSENAWRVCGFAGNWAEFHDLESAKRFIDDKITVDRRFKERPLPKVTYIRHP